MKVYLVGGWVRDHLLYKQLSQIKNPTLKETDQTQFLKQKLKTADKDWVVVGSDTDEMKAQGFRQVGKDFPVFLHPKTKEEYALARLEKKTGKGYHGFGFEYGSNVSLLQDLKRRDLTINAMAMDSDTGEVIDPFGGLEDLKKKVLKHTSSAFKEDPLRLLRVARFWAYLADFGFQIQPETLDVLKSISKSGELALLAPERIWTEFKKAVQFNRLDCFVELLVQTQAHQSIWQHLGCTIGHKDDVFLQKQEVLKKAKQKGLSQVALLGLMLSTLVDAKNFELVAKHLRIEKIQAQLLRLEFNYGDLLKFKSKTLDIQQSLELFRHSNSLHQPELFYHFTSMQMVKFGLHYQDKLLQNYLKAWQVFLKTDIKTIQSQLQKTIKPSQLPAQIEKWQIEAIQKTLS